MTIQDELDLNPEKQQLQEVSSGYSNQVQNDLKHSNEARVNSAANSPRQGMDVPSASINRSIFRIVIAEPKFHHQILQPCRIPTVISKSSSPVAQTVQEIIWR
ncbi:hypothetical protein BofuT4_P054190.1 [Botrytis cinerea T4]|uniref:Uncharacterized protein n=1 Tax=Botryotinia fuckeliana (strain T4) TaxID=999810 RepID=G2XVJ8_BOTF4|nr:hypothetical protein BofuT4_P054190.1 [Botrytis cinerea T4]